MKATKTPLMLGSVLALACATTACTGAEDAEESQTVLELLTWWSQDSELAAIDAVIAVNRAKHPHVNIRVLKAKDQSAMISDVRRGLADGMPPSAFQTNLGGNALQWAESAQPLNSLAKAWSGDFQESILERVTYDGDLIAVPLALTRQNNAYYNLKLLNELGLEIPEGRQQFEAWLSALAELGYTHPLCLGDQKNWVSTHALFEDIVPAYIGAEHSQAFWTGKLSADDPGFAEALDYAATLNPYWNPDFDQLDFVPGLQRLMEERDPAEQCLMTPMGDWGGPILAGDYEVDEDFAQRAWPGAEGLFVLAGDAFVTTRGVKDASAALDFFETLASEDGQVAFNAKKGSVPARTLPEARRSEFSALTRANMADLASGTALPAFKVLGSSAFPWDDLGKLAHDFLLVGDKQPVIDFIAENYDKLGT